MELLTVNEKGKHPDEILSEIKIRLNRIGLLVYRDYNLISGLAYTYIEVEDDKNVPFVIMTLSDMNCMLWRSNK
jgi:hypothetical protein